MVFFFIFYDFQTSTLEQESFFTLHYPGLDNMMFNEYLILEIHELLNRTGGVYDSNVELAIHTILRTYDVNVTGEKYWDRWLKAKL
jgi:hypothetical protein